MKKYLVWVLALFFLTLTVLPVVSVRAGDDPDADSLQNIGADKTKPLQTIRGDTSFSLQTCGDSNSGGTGIQNPLKVGNLSCLLYKVVDQFLIFGEVIGAIFLIWSGFLFVKARGDEEALKTARKTFYGAVIGIAILLAAKVIAEIIQNTINKL